MQLIWHVPYNVNLWRISQAVTRPPSSTVPKRFVTCIFTVRRDSNTAHMRCPVSFTQGDATTHMQTKSFNSCSRYTQQISSSAAVPVRQTINSSSQDSSTWRFDCNRECTGLAEINDSIRHRYDVEITLATIKRQNHRSDTRVTGSARNANQLGQPSLIAVC